MALNRLEVLRSMLEQDPGNSFALYGIAMEYVNAGDLASAANEFARLIATNPDYVAAYFHGGQALEKLGRLEEARDVYVSGLAACTRIGDAHTEGEIRAALDLM